MSTQVLSVTLPSEVIYVSGTVNGVAKTWTLVEDAWQTTAERADNDTYVVALTAVNAAGTSASYELTLYYGVLNLITDRTRADVERVAYLRGRVAAGTATEAEEAEWETVLKGAYNASDLNRVGAAVAYLAERFTDQGYAVTVEPKTDWMEEAWPTASDMERYLADVEKLRAQIAVMDTTPQTPESMENLTYTAANDIEQILLDLDELLTHAQQAWFYSGELYAGEI